MAHPQDPSADDLCIVGRLTKELRANNAHPIETAANSSSGDRRCRLRWRAGVLEIQQELAEIEAGAGEITEVDCPLQLPGEEEGETNYCGVYSVPSDYDNPQGDTLNLTYMVLRATGDDPVPDPIVFLAGGPGQSGIVAA